MAAKIKDGLFIGDAATSQDPEFLELNKICNLVNLAGSEIPNIWAAHGLVYLTFNWENDPNYPLFDAQDEILHEISSFIDMSLSLQGTCRCAVAACAYLMYKYGWGFEKSYDFLVIKSSEIDINRGFVQQLFQLERHLMISKHKVYDIKQLTPQQYARMHSWDAESYLSGNEEEERVLVNSYNNSKTTLRSLPRPSADPPAPKSFSLTFNLKPSHLSSTSTQVIHHPAPPDAPRPVSILKTSKTNQRRSAPPLPSESNGRVSIAAPKTATSVSTDLYDFVGLRPSSRDGSKGIGSSAEERLHKILSNLQSSSRSEAKTTVIDQHEEEFVSIHDLARAPVTTTYAPPSQQPNKQLRASGGVVLSNSATATGQNVRQQAWTEEKQHTAPARKVPQPNNKRHASPAPQLSRSGLASRANSSNSSASVGSYASNNSYRSNASSQQPSNGSRGQTPTRQRPSTPTRRSQPQVSSSLLQPTIASSRGQQGGDRRPPSPSRTWKY